MYDCGGPSGGNPTIGLSPVTQRQPLSDPTAKTTLRHNVHIVHIVHIVNIVRSQLTKKCASWICRRDGHAKDSIEERFDL